MEVQWLWMHLRIMRQSFAEERRADRERIPLDGKDHKFLGNILKTAVAAGERWWPTGRPP